MDGECESRAEEAEEDGGSLRLHDGMDGWIRDGRERLKDQKIES